MKNPEECRMAKKRNQKHRLAYTFAVFGTLLLSSEYDLFKALRDT
jgi:hypothetical protein